MPVTVDRDVSGAMPNRNATNVMMNPLGRKRR
jgi:hypothetical protein